MEMPSPVLILGDRHLSQNNVNGAKKKYSQYKWCTFSASKDDLDKIRITAGQRDFLSNKKVILINDLPNKKVVREFLLDIVKMSSDRVKFIIWDSTGTMKVDPKTKRFNKTWNDFIKAFKLNKDCKVVNNGGKFSDKEDRDCVQLIVGRFEKAKREISQKNAILLSEIVGRTRGMLESEISKLLFICPKKVTAKFITENAFPTSKEAVIYRFGNVLDTCDYGASLCMMQKFLDAGINENVLAETMMRKARWQLAASSLWSEGLSWNEVSHEMMQMGKYPSKIWHDKSMSTTEKRKLTESLKDIDGRMQYIQKVGGLPDWQVDSSKTTKRAEVIPQSFMATLTCDFIKKNIVASNINKYNDKEMKNALVNRCLKVYLYISKRLKDVRYGENPRQDLNEMVAALTSKVL